MKISTTEKINPNQFSIKDIEDIKIVNFLDKPKILENISKSWELKEQIFLLNNHKIINEKCKMCKI